MPRRLKLNYSENKSLNRVSKKLPVALLNFLKNADARARLPRFLLGVAYLLFLYLFQLLALRQSYKEIGRWTIPFYGIIFGSGFVAFQFIRRSHRSQDRLLAISFSVTPPSQADLVSRSVLDYLAARTMITASLLTRGGSEFYLQNHKVPDGLNVITRQSQNEFLRRCGLWENLEPAELGLVSAADGAWPAEQLNRLGEWCEQLRLLRWVLRIDSFLKPMSHFPRTDFLVSRGLNTLGRPFVAKQALEPSEIRPERDVAAGYFLSAAQELRRRGLVSAAEPIEREERQMQAMTQFVVDGRYVSELSDDELQQILRVAHTRSNYAQYLIDQLSAGTPVAYSARRPAEP